MAEGGYADYDPKGWYGVNESVEFDTFIRNEAMRVVVKGMYRTIVENVMDISIFMDWFIQENVFSIDNKHRMLAPHSPQNCCREMLDALLISTHSTAFFVFLMALKGQYDWLVIQINQEVDAKLRDPNFLPSLKNTRCRTNLDLEISSHYTRPGISLSAVFTQNQPNFGQQANSISANGVTDKNRVATPIQESSGNIPNSHQNQVVSILPNFQQTAPSINTIVTVKAPKPQPPPKPSLQKCQDKEKSTVQYLVEELTHYKQLLSKQEEELKQCQNNLEVIRKIADGTGGWDILKSCEREKELQDKLKREEEKNKALTAQLEFCKNLTQNQLDLRREVSIAKSDSSSNYEEPDVKAAAAPSPAISEAKSEATSASSSSSTTRKPYINKVSLQISTPARSRNLEYHDTDSDDSFEKEPVKMKSSAASASKKIFINQRYRPAPPPRIPIPKSPVLRSISINENRGYDSIPFDNSASKTIADFEIDPDNVELLDRVFFTPHIDIWKGKFKNSGKQVSVKRLTVDDEGAREIFLNEVEILIKLQHLNVIEILGVTAASFPYYIVLESLDENDLLTLLQLDKGKRITPQTIVNFSKQIADGMNYLEKNNYVHRNLNATAILLTGTEEYYNWDRVVKITQFRLAAYVGNTNGVFRSNLSTDTPSNSMVSHTAIRRRWTAPEALRTKRWTTKCDVWSYGVLLYEMLTYGEPPYLDIKESELIESLESGYRLPCPTSQDQNSQEVYDVIYNQVMLRCWNIIAENRPSFSSLSDFLEALSFERPGAPLTPDSDDFLLTSIASVGSTTSRSKSGTLEVSTSGLNRVPSFVKDRYCAYPRLVGEITPESGHESVGGIAVLHQLVYIVRQGTYSVEVYDEKLVSLKSAGPKHRLTIEGTKAEKVESKPKSKSKKFVSVFSKKKKPALSSTSAEKGLTDVTAITTKGWLFFADPSESRIHRIDPANVKTSHTCWQVEGDPRTLAVDKNENLYVSCPELGAIQIYSCDGVFIRRTNPEVSGFGPLHALPFEGEKMVYCHELDNSYYTAGHVSICDKKGKEIIKLSERESFSCPTYLSLDPYSNQVILAEAGRRSIWIMRSTGRSQARELLKFNGNAVPVRLFLRRNSGELYVGMQDGRVLVYEVIKSKGAGNYSTTYGRLGMAMTYAEFPQYQRIPPDDYENCYATLDLCD